MKSILFVVICLMTSTFLRGQNDKSTSQTNSSITVLLKEISEKYDTPIIYNPKIFDNYTKEYSLPTNANDLSIDGVLRLLIDQSLYEVIHTETSILIKQWIKKDISISGYIKQSSTGISLPYSTLSVIDQGIYTTANENGHYQLKGHLPMTILISYLGHQDTTIILEEYYDQSNLNIELSPNNVIQEITINDRPISDHFNGRYYYQGDRIRNLTKNLPGVGGNNDILHATRGVAGISAGNGSVGGHFIRGGDNSQNLFLLDEVALYNPFHSLGMTSVITSDNSQNLQIFKSAFRPHYIDKSAGIIDIKIREGNMTDFEAKANVNTQDASLNLQGPIIKGHTSMYISGRTTTLSGPFNQVIGEALYDDLFSENNTDYTDLLIKIKSKLNARNTLEATFYKGDDSVKGENEDEINLTENQRLLNWGNEIYNLKWNSQMSNTLFWSNRVSMNKYYSNFKTLTETEGDENSLLILDNSSLNSDTQWESRIDWLLSPKWRIRSGISYLSKEFAPNSDILTEDSEELAGSDNININDLPEPGDVEELESALITWYTESTYESTKDKINIGYRLSQYDYEGYNTFNLSPRFSWTRYTTDNHHIELSASHTVQYEHILSSTDINFPQDIWHPASDRLLPENGWHLNLAHIWNRNNFKLRSEVYHKSIDNIVYSSFQPIVGGYDAFNLSTIQGKAKSYGLELSGHHVGDRLELLFSYALSNATHQFESLNLGEPFPSQFSRISELNIMGSWAITPQLHLGSVMYLASGTPQLLVNSISEDTGLVPIDDSVLGMKNSTRNDPTHRMDLSLSYEFSTGPLAHVLKANLYNVYNASSPLFFSEISGEMVPNFALPTIFSVAYSVRF